jgi:hypothetical protein
VASGIGSTEHFKNYGSIRSSKVVKSLGKSHSSSLAWLTVGSPAGAILLFLMSIFVGRVQLSELALGMAGYVTCSTVGVYGVVRMDARRRGSDALRERQQQEYKLRLAEVRRNQLAESPQPGSRILTVVPSLEEQR